MRLVQARPGSPRWMREAMEARALTLEAAGYRVHRARVADAPLKFQGADIDWMMLDESDPNPVDADGNPIPWTPPS